MAGDRAVSGASTGHPFSSAVGEAVRPCHALATASPCSLCLRCPGDPCRHQLSCCVLPRAHLRAAALLARPHPQALGRVWTLGPPHLCSRFRELTPNQALALVPWCPRGSPASSPPGGGGTSALLFLQPNIGHLGLPHGPSGEKVAVVTVDSCDTAVAVHFGSYIGNYSCAAQGTQSGSKK